MTRAQASLEFLTTYGWAFMVIMVMIGALSYYGITNPTVFVPERCAFSPEISCEDFQLVYASDASIVMVNLKQTTGKSVYIADFFCDDVDTDGGSQGYYHEETMAPETITAPYRDLGDGDPQNDGTGDPDFDQWDPAEDVTVKCVFDLNPFQNRIDDRVRVPVHLVINQREGGFDHEIQGEIVGVVKEMS